MIACDKHGVFEGGLKEGVFGATVKDLNASVEDQMSGQDVVFRGDLCPRCFAELKAWFKEAPPKTVFEVTALNDAEKLRVLNPPTDDEAVDPMAELEEGR